MSDLFPSFLAGDPGLLIEGAWKQTCARCGSGNNLHLDKITNKTIPCCCQSDGIRTTDPGVAKARPQSARRPFTPSNCYSYSVGQTAGVYASGYAPAGGGGFRTRPPAPPPAAFLAPFRMHRSFNAQAATRRSQPQERLVLKYTDAGIPKPPTNSNVRLTNSGGSGGSSIGSTFPKLVTKYISRQNSKDGATTYIETFRQTSNKVAIVTQSFSM